MDIFLKEIRKEIPFIRKDFLKFEGSFKTDVKETEKEYVFLMEVPGLKKEDIEITYDQNILSIKGKYETSEEKFNIKERYEGEFIRRFKVSDVDAEKIEAELKDGILKINLIKKEGTGKQIQIK